METVRKEINLLILSLYLSLSLNVLTYPLISISTTKKNLVTIFYLIHTSIFLKISHSSSDFYLYLELIWCVL